AIAAERKAGDRVLCYGVYLHGLAFYTRAPVDVANWVGELHYAKRDPANAGRFGDDETIRALPDDGHRAFVAFRSKEAPWLTSLARPGHLLRMRGFGPWALAEFSAPKQGR
ncbi:MAG: hypothetical protein NTX64_05800, partial [Elusimicrobia bacterium]|nr:hypothetical protein [Elusimicrobiota bacterium]